MLARQWRSEGRDSDVDLAPRQIVRLFICNTIAIVEPIAAIRLVSRRITRRIPSDNLQPTLLSNALDYIQTHKFQ